MASDLGPTAVGGLETPPSRATAPAADVSQQLQKSKDQIDQLQGQVRAIETRLEAARKQIRRGAMARRALRDALTAEVGRLRDELQAGRDEIDRLEAELRDARTSHVATDPDAIDVLSRERDAVAAERDRLRVEVEAVRSEFDARSAEVGRLEAEGRERQPAWERERRDLLDEIERRVEEEHEARTRAETACGVLQTEAEAARREREDVAREVETAGVERDEAEAVRRAAEHDQQAEIGRVGAARDQAQQAAADATRRENALAERVRALEAQLEQRERDAVILRHELDAERRGRRELDDVRLKTDRDRQTLRDELERSRGEAEAAREQALWRIEALGAERDQLAALYDAAEASGCEAERRLQAEVDRLTRERDEARKQADASARRADDLAARIRERDSELDRLQRARDAEGREYTRALADLRDELDNERARAEAERDRVAKDAEEAMEDLERWLAETRDELRAASERAEGLEADARTARDAVKAPAPAPPRDDVDAEDRACVDELTRQLRQAHDANERLRSLLNVFGMVNHV